MQAEAQDRCLLVKNPQRDCCLSNSYVVGSEQKCSFTSFRIIPYFVFIPVVCDSDDLFNLILKYPLIYRHSKWLIFHLHPENYGFLKNRDYFV